ncbi:MAG: glycoside hydrolase family 5 protein, partial [Candidatus Hinthialibacter sp.]
AAAGFDHVRIPIDEEQMWKEDGRQETEAFALLNQAIQWAQKHNLRVVVDLHILRSHHFNADEKPLWTDPKAQEKFFDLWRDLSSELKNYPVSLAAYELMNEPVADDADDWNRLVENAVKVIRQNEPNRTIVIGSNRWQSAGTFDELKIPENDRNIILSFHFYNPMLITHYRASWNNVGKYRGPVHYPGRLVDAADLEKLPPDIAEIVKRNNGVYDKERLEGMIQEPLRVAQKYNLPLYCGEWGCITLAPREVRLKWYQDFRSILDENGIAWANWDYKDGFGIRTRDGRPDEELISILLPKK